MHRMNLRRGVAMLAVVASAGLMAACTPPTSSGAPKRNFTFTADSVFINESQDFTGPCVFGVCVSPAKDEPFVINIGFTVDVGKANSATSSVVTGDNAWSGVFDQGPEEGTGVTFSGGQKGAYTFSQVPLLQFSDILANAVLAPANQNHLRVVGVWTWAMEADLLGIGGLATSASDVIKSALNTFVAGSGSGATAEAFIQSIIDALLDNLFPALGGLVSSIIPFAGDDMMGSRMYIGLGVRGDLKSALTSILSGVTFPSINLPVIPDLLGGKIVGLGTQSFTGQVFDQPSQGSHTYTLSFTQS